MFSGQDISHSDGTLALPLGEIDMQEVNGQSNPPNEEKIEPAEDEGTLMVTTFYLQLFINHSFLFS